jgi:hypothetical protein
VKTLTIIDNGKDRASWLKARQQGWTTATQAAIIVGSHPYSKLIDLWNEKTDPAYAGEEPNYWLMERAELGIEREPEIIAWASERPELGPGKLTPNRALVTRDGIGKAACTPDSFKYRRNGTQPIIVDAKATQQNWNPAGTEPIAGAEAKGVPQHVIDQMQWTYWVTDALEVWLAVEQYQWIGRGKAKHPELVDTKLIFVPRDENRLDYLKAAVTRWEGWVEQGIAPESDIRLEAGPDLDFDDTPEQIEAKLTELAEMNAIDEALTEVAEIRERIAADLDREKALIDKVIKPYIKQFEGRRVWAIGERFTAKLVRGTRTSLDASKLDPLAVMAATKYSESEIVKLEPNPEYVAPTGDDDYPTERA